MNKRRKFKQYVPDQLLLLPLDMREWLPENHLVWLIADVVEEQDLRAIEDTFSPLRGTSSLRNLQLKEIGRLRRARFVGRWKIQLYAYAAAATYNFLRLEQLSAA